MSAAGVVDMRLLLQHPGHGRVPGGALKSQEFRGVEADANRSGFPDRDRSESFREPHRLPHRVADI